MLTGEFAALAKLHPKRIISPVSSAKLITGAALPIGFESSFKAHAVLRRLISEGGIQLGDRTFVAWDADGNSVMRNTNVQDNTSVTVLVLHEVNRGNIAVSFYERTTAKTLHTLVREKEAGKNEDATGRLLEQKLRRELNY